MSGTTVAIGLVYFAASSLMLLVNKLVVTFIPTAVIVTTFQYVMAVIVVVLATKLGRMDADLSFKWDVVKKYSAIPLLFSLAIFSNMKVLEAANVETFMVFRFSTPISVAIVDFALMGKSLPSIRTWISFIMIVTGAVWYTLTDEGFSVKTYFWIVIYLVTITAEMIVVKHIFTTIKMSNWTRVYLNNSLSLFYQPFFFFLVQEYRKFPFKTEVAPVGWVYLVLSGVLGTGLAWSGTALRARISATSFTVVGVACKVVTELVNLVMWDKHANEMGLLALLLCFIGSIIFVPSPMRSADTRISNAIWNGCNKVLCGLFSRFELESPEFLKIQQHETVMEAKYAPVNTTELEADVEMKPVDDNKESAPK